MRTCLCLPLWTGLLTAHLFAASIEFRVSDPPGSLGRYSYFVSGVTLQANQELDIRFAPNLFSTLSDGVAGSGFELLLFQPNNPPGTFGDYGALALANNTGFTGSFGVDFIFMGQGSPGPQLFFIYQFDQNGDFISTIDSGMTELAGPSGVPEPAGFVLSGAGLLVIGVAWWSSRRRSRAERCDHVRSY